MSNAIKESNHSEIPNSSNSELDDIRETLRLSIEMAMTLRDEIQSLKQLLYEVEPFIVEYAQYDGYPWSEFLDKWRAMK